MGRLVSLIFAVIALCSIISCNTSGCLENQSAIPLAAFYNSDNEAITLDSLEISGIGAVNDSILSSPGTSVSQIYLPMRSTQETTSWCIAYKWAAFKDYYELNDTVTFRYNSIPYFTSEECGATYRYNVHTVDYTTHLIDSVVMVDSLITNVDKVYIKIYFRTASNDDTDE